MALPLFAALSLVLATPPLDLIDAAPAASGDPAAWQQRGRSALRAQARPHAHLARQASSRGLGAQTPRRHARSDEFDIPIVQHPLVDRYIQYFTGRGRGHFALWLTRLELYRERMTEILRKAGVPRDLLYLAMIESGFSPHATSAAQATGYWQFMRSTGHDYGLRNDLWVDERRDFVRSTQAAAAHLRGLHETLGDWQLAWASYNAGLGRVRRAMERHRAASFWQLAQVPRSLATETLHYVPKIMAAALIAKAPARYGFAPPVPLPPLAYDEVSVGAPTSLPILARQMKLPSHVLRQLNPALLYAVTPPRSRMKLRVPAGRGPEARALLAAQPANTRFAMYAVRRGDTLTGIARRHRVPLALLTGLNERAGHRLRIGQQLLVPEAVTPPQRPRLSAPRVASRSVPQARTAAAVQSAAAATARTASMRHTVGRGDTLGSIAELYGVSIGRLKRWNGRRHNRLNVGEVLRIF